MHKKYFFFDIDGTLTDEKTHRIVPSALWTLHQLEKEGHFVSIASGRAHYKTRSFTDSIGIQNIVCCGGGCLVVNGEIVENQPLPLDKAKQILKHADENGLGYLLMLDDSDTVYFKDYRFLEQAGRRTELTTYHYDPNLDPMSLDCIYKIYLYATKEIEEENNWINTLGHLRMGKTYMVFQHDAKKDGIIRMMEHLGGPLEDVVVFGDAVNDLVMFDKRWTSIAMGNACDALKEKSSFVTKKNVEDGIYYACQKFGWITKDINQ